MRIYADHAATSPLRDVAREAWLDAQRSPGNASSVHAAGRRARAIVEDARESVARLLDCDPVEVVFTSGGTESINLALKGLWWARIGGEAIVLPDGEHHATMEAVGWLETQGADVRTVPLTDLGAISVDAFADALPGAALATAIVANNEVGTVNDAARLAFLAGEADVPLHLDAVAALGVIPLRFAELGGTADGASGLVALSVSGHKVGAPIGTGALLVARRARLAPLLHGGTHQRSLRAGTEDVAGAAAFAAALTEAETERESESARIAALRDELRDRIARTVPEAVMLGDAEHRVPGNLHVLFPGALGETLLFLLDHAGISASTGSACTAGVTEPSHVVRALGRDERDARSVIRFTLGAGSTPADVAAIADAVPDAYRRARAASGASTRT